MKRAIYGVCIVVGQAILVTTLTRTANAQTLPDEVKAVLAHRVGHWQGHNYVLGPDGSVSRVEEENHEAQAIINGEIVEIRGIIDGREDFRAFLLYNPRIGKYVYSTIDRTNNHGDMTAEPDAPYRLTSNPITLPDGRSLLFRLVFETVEQDLMEGYGESSLDGGTTWRRVYNQVLRRVDNGSGPF